MRISIASDYYAVSVVILLQLWKANCIECDKYYVLFEETKNTTEPSSNKVTLFTMPEGDLAEDVMRSLNNVSIHKECVLSLTSCAPETYCPIATKTEQLKTNEKLTLEKEERDKKNLIIGASVFVGSLGTAAGIYFVGRKIQGLMQSDTYRLP